MTEQKLFSPKAPCVRGHLAPRRIKGSNCTECERESSRAWNRRNRERASKARNEWCAKNPEKRRKAQRDAYARNPQKAKDRNAKYRAGSIEKVRARQKRWADNNRELVRKYAARFRADNPEKKRADTRNRRAALRAAEGRHTAADIEEISRAQRNRCAMCRNDFGRVKRHVDHIVPIAGGGRNDRRNLQLLCSSCNTSKGARDPIQFAQSRGLLL